MNLYQINEEMKAIISQADENGEIDVDQFEGLQIEKEEKQLNVIKYIKHLENDKAAIDNEIKRLQCLKTLASRRVDSLSKYLGNSMKIDGVNELDMSIFKAKFKKNPPRLVIADEALVPQKYVKQEVVTSIDKNSIKLDLKGGQEIEGCTLEQEERLEIK